MICNLYLFPHQDDETFIFEKISFDVRNNIKPVCLFLTQNENNILNEKRNNESLRFLQVLGVSREDIIFVGAELGVLDGVLVYKLSEVFSKLKNIIELYINNSNQFKNIYVPAYEGGHQDHDTTTFLGFELARYFSLDKSEKEKIVVFQFWCYNGYQTRNLFFRVKYIIPLQNNINKSLQLETQYNIYKVQRTFRDFLFLIVIPFYYLTQKKTWIGLYPEFLLRGLLFGLQITELKSFNYEDKPHDGFLLYERWKRETFENWKQKIKNYIQLC